MNEIVMDAIDDLLANLADDGHVEECWYMRGTLDALDGRERETECGEYRSAYNAGYNAALSWTER